MPAAATPSASSYFLTVKQGSGGLMQGLTLRGTAVAIKSHSNQCTLLTAAHVVRSAASIIVVPWSEMGAASPTQDNVGRLLASSDAADLAVIEAPLAHDCHPAALVSVRPPIGTEIMIYGHPLDNAGLLTFGRIGAYWDTSTSHGLLGVSDALAHPGTSGAGLFTSDGQLVGIVEGISDEGPNPAVADPHAAEIRPRHLSYFVPIDRAQNLVPSAFDLRQPHCIQSPGTK